MTKAHTGKTKNDIIREIYEDQTYKNICKAFTRMVNWEDLHSIFISIMCNKSEEKLQDIYYNYNVEYIRNYCCGVLVKQYYSSASTFYYQYRRYNLTHRSVGCESDIIYQIPHSEHPDDNDALNCNIESDIQSIYEQIDKVVSSQHWYNARLFKLWLEKGSVRKVEKDFKNENIKISKSAIQKSVKQTKTIIKNTLKNPFRNQ